MEEMALYNYDFNEINGYIECEIPNDKLNEFNGKMKLDTVGEEISLQHENVRKEMLFSFYLEDLSCETLSMYMG